MPADTAAEPKIKTSMAGLELPWDLAAFGEERLGNLDVGDLRSECARRGLDVKPRAQKNTCIKFLLEWKGAQGVGYRHMIRLFTRMLWDLAAELGYEYVMRLDEESFIYSRIPYNIFARMRDGGLDYGYRMVSYESGFSDE